MAVTTTTTSREHWCVWTALRCDLEQVGKTAKLYRYISPTWKRMNRQSQQVPRFGHSQGWTEHTGTRFLTHCKRTPIFCEDGETTIARDGVIAIPDGFYFTDDGPEEIEENEVPQILLQARPAFRHPGYRACPRRSRCSADSLETYSAPDEMQVQEIRTAYEALEHSTAETAHKVPSVPKGIDDNATMKGTIDVAWRSGEDTKGFISVAGTHGTETLRSLGHHGLSSLLILEKSSGIRAPRRESSGNSN